MTRYRLWYGEKPQYIEVDSISEAILLLRKDEDKFPEESSGLEKFENGEWDEWLDTEDQNIHEHIFMFGKTSAFIKDLEDLEDLEDDHEEEDIYEDKEERFINAISSDEVADEEF